MERVRVLIGKEWLEASKNRTLVLTAVLLTLLFSFFPLFILGTTGAAAHEMRQRPQRPASEQLPPGWQNPAYQGMSTAEVVQAHVSGQFLVFFLIGPLMMPMTIATYSIIGEKRDRSLEALLATPVSTSELLLGKAVAAAVPGIAIGWISFAVFTFGARMLVVSPAVFGVLFSPARLLLILVVAPLLTILGAITGLMVSSRAQDARDAQQVGGLIALPLIALIPAQLLGLVTLSISVVIPFALFLAVLDGALLYFARLLFQRETILTRWG